MIPDGNKGKKYFFDRFPQIENRKTKKFVPPTEKQLSYPELGYKCVSYT